MTADRAVGSQTIDKWNEHRSLRAANHGSIDHTLCCRQYAVPYAVSDRFAGAEHQGLRSENKFYTQYLTHLSTHMSVHMSVHVAYAHVCTYFWMHVGTRVYTYVVTHVQVPSINGGAVTVPRPARPRDSDR